MTGENCVKNCGGLVEDQDPPLHTKHITERLVLPTMKTTTTPKPAVEDLSLRKRKMKRVKVERGRGKISESRSRAILNRARLRSRMSSSSSVVSSSTEQSIGQNELEVSRTFRRPARMVGSTNGQNSTSSLELETHFNGVGGSRNELYPARTRHRDYLGGSQRVDEVMKAPPNMKGGLVVIRSYCRFFFNTFSPNLKLLNHCQVSARGAPTRRFVSATFLARLLLLQRLGSHLRAALRQSLHKVPQQVE